MATSLPSAADVRGLQISARPATSEAPAVRWILIGLGSVISSVISLSAVGHRIFSGFC